jgi:hypothetical protein
MYLPEFHGLEVSRYYTEPGMLVWWIALVLVVLFLVSAGALLGMLS